MENPDNDWLCAYCLRRIRQPSEARSPEEEEKARESLIHDIAAIVGLVFVILLLVAGAKKSQDLFWIAVFVGASIGAIIWGATLRSKKDVSRYIDSGPRFDPEAEARRKLLRMGNRVIALGSVCLILTLSWFVYVALEGEAPSRVTPSSGYSEAERRKIYYDLVDTQDLAPYSLEWGQAAKEAFAKEYQIPMSELNEIIHEGATEGWPTPPLP